MTQVMSEVLLLVSQNLKFL